MKKIALLLAFILFIMSVPLSWADGGDFSRFNPSREFPDGKFADVKESDWFSKYVKKAYSYSLIDGNSATTYNPGGDVTVAETLVIACNLNKIYFDTEIPSVDGAWYAKFVEYALAKGIIQKGEYSNYNAKATRRQFGSILANSLPAETYEPIVEIEDYAIPDVAMADAGADKIYLLYRAGILGGSDAEGSFFPESNIKRSEVATIISNIVDPSSRGGVSRKADSIGLTWNEFLAELNEKREKQTLSHHMRSDIEPYLPDFKDTLSLVSEAEAKELNTYKKPVETVDKAAAKQDVDLLFRLFKAYYASWAYFGGENTFEKAKSAIVQAIDGQSESIIDTDWMAKTICRNLSFIRDGHAAIGPYVLCDENNQCPYDYYVEGYSFYRDESGYYTRIGGKRTYLTAVGNDKQVDKYLRVSVDDLGRLCYILSISEVNNGPLLKIKTIEFQTGEKHTNQAIEWTEFKVRNWDNSAWYQSIALHNGIPYVAIADTQNGSRDEELENTFTNIHSYLDLQNVAIYNILTTGSGRYAVFGENIPVENAIRAYKVSNVIRYIGKTNYPQGTLAGNYAIQLFTPQWRKDNALKFIVQDRNNASAHEDFLAGLATVQNTIFVGGRSRGLQITGGNHHFYLPNSHLQAQMGMFLAFQSPGTVNIDGIGYEPDIWVSLDNSVDAIYRLCSFYGLENKSSTDQIRTSPYYVDYSKATARENFYSRLPAASPEEPNSSPRITLYFADNKDTILPNSGFGFGLTTKILTVQYDGKKITNYEFSLLGSNVGSVAKNAKGELILTSKTPGDAEIKITYRGASASFGWHVE